MIYNSVTPTYSFNEINIDLFAYVQLNTNTRCAILVPENCLQFHFRRTFKGSLKQHFCPLNCAKLYKTFTASFQSVKTCTYKHDE